MKVRDLISELSVFNPDADVMINPCEGYSNVNWVEYLTIIEGMTRFDMDCRGKVGQTVVLIG